MTTKVALQTPKRRKMGYDYVEGSGYPMDGIELDSSSSAALPANSSRAGSSSSTRPYSPTSPYYGLEPAGNSSGIAPSSPAYGPQRAPTTMSSTIESTTSDRIAPTASNQIKQSDNVQTANSSSRNKQQQNQAQQQQESHLPTNDSAADFEEDDISDPANDLTNNEAMTMEDDNDYKFFKKGKDPDILKMLGAWGNDMARAQRQQHADRRAANVGARSDNFQTQTVSEDQAALPRAVRSFGDLFDDDDLD